MNQIFKRPVNTLGYDFIPKQFLPRGKDEYYLRNAQNRSEIQYRNLVASEIETLVRNNNTSDNWNCILVSESFNPELVRNCKFYGLVRIGKLEPFFLEFHDFRAQVGLYNSTIISCDFGDNVVIDNVNYISHFIVGSEVMITNVNELGTTNHAKFGNGILKEGEDESIRIWLEICNENAGRRVIPFNGMLPGDAFLWSRFRDDEVFQNKLKEFTQDRYDSRRGYYGKIGDRTVIKNSKIIKDVWIGTDAYIKGANKLKNLTINSSPEEKSQIGEGCELVNGIIGYGCRIFYGVKAVRFFMASNSQLKYGARLINSYLGNNATISCCEVLNSLIFPAHEQHHNNSFLCAATVLGQSNMAAGATIGSNHNSRAADGEIIAGRGFWPGLSVTLKHNSRFASFTLVAKGDYSHELDIKIPFSLVSLDTTKNRVVVMPAYWFRHNMYALARNAWKSRERDKRKDKIQFLEYDFLAPDTVNEMFLSLKLMEDFVAKSLKLNAKKVFAKTAISAAKEKLRKAPDDIDALEIFAEKFEYGKHQVQLLNVGTAYTLFCKMIRFYGACILLEFSEEKKNVSFEKMLKNLPKVSSRENWVNLGGQLIPETKLERFITDIKSGKIKSWEAVHAFYEKMSTAYTSDKLQHALTCILELSGKRQFKKSEFSRLLTEANQTRKWISQSISSSRAKDYNNPFRKMVYKNEAEMRAVVGNPKKNTFIQLQLSESELFDKRINKIIQKYRL